MEHLLQTERETAADLAHRLRTPLAAARLDAEALSDDPVRDQILEDLDELERTVDFIIGEGRRPVRTEIDPGCDLAVVVADRTAFWSPLSEEQGRSFTTALDVPHAHVAIPEVDAGVMIDALLENVFAHTDERVPIAIRLISADAASVLLEVEDGGGGLADVGAVERGASTADSTGLGLDIVRRTAEASGGSFELEEPGLLGGARVSVRLPLLDSRTAWRNGG
jgi:signal transduction histidine kinase